MKCFHCNESPILLAECKCIAYYIIGFQGETRLFIHQGSHDHPVAKGILRISIQRTCDLVLKILSNTTPAGPRHLQLNISKQMLFDAVICDDGTPLETKEILSLFEEMKPLVHTSR